MDLWYRDHKDGILGIVTTILVSFVTALIAVLLAR
jgi:ABC-type phosphate transport system permease subunit